MGEGFKRRLYFLEGMTRAMSGLAEQARNGLPVTIYYAFKQSEKTVDGNASTGWETFLTAVLKAGFGITGTWPMRTEYTGNLKKSSVPSLPASYLSVGNDHQTHQRQHAEISSDLCVPDFHWHSSTYRRAI